MASVISRRFLSTTARRMESKSGSELKKESKRNPEIIVRHKPRWERSPGILPG
jgi:hypothetical protein